MSKALISENLLTDIADAIRSKTGDSGTLTPVQMASEIADLPDAPSGQIEITENGEVDVAAFASALVNVAGGGGASNVVTGTFSFITSSTSMEVHTVNIPYTGAGYPRAVIIYPDTPISKNGQYTVEFWCCYKEYKTEPTYDGDYAVYLYVYNSATTGVKRSYAGGDIKTIYAQSNPQSAFANLVKIVDNKTIKLGIRGSNMGTSNRGFAQMATYRYVIYYEE